MNIAKDILSLSDFKRNTSTLTERMVESGEPLVLTVNGKATLVVQDAASYQKLLDATDYADAVRGIAAGLQDVEAGRGKPAAQVYREMRRKHGISKKRRA